MELFKIFGSIAINDKEARQGLRNLDGEAQGTGNRMMNTFKKVGGVLAAAFAIDKIKDFGVSAVESAAEAQAISAQFDQVFGDVGKLAQKTIDGLGKDFGMVPKRIKPAMTQMTSMFKGLGLDTEAAMNQAKDAVTLTADAAAFYDKSFEDANAALNSFVKGNYEGGESIGLFANETQLASWASANLGEDWKTLDEAGKQVARLKFAKAMQEAAGATGQASRESDGYQNQLGNLKAVWDDVKAKFGEPFLKPVVAGLKGLSNWLQGNLPAIQNTVSTVFDFIKNGAKTVTTFFTERFGGMVGTFRDIIEKIKGIAKGYIDYVKQIFSGEGNVGESFVRIFNVIKSIALPILQDAISFIKGKFAEIKQFWDENGAQIIQAVKNMWSVIAAIFEFFMPAIQFIVEMVWGNIKGVISGALDIIMGLVKVFAGLFTGDFSKMWEGIKQLFSGAIEFVWNLINLLMFGKILGGIKAFATKSAAGFKGFLDKAVEIFKNLDDKVWGLVKSLVSKAKGGFDDLLGNAKGIFNKVKDAIIKPVQAAKDKVIGFIDKIKSAFKNMGVKIALPHFSVSNFSLNPKDWVKNGLPKLAVDWYATGTNFAPGGMAMVGERGPELIHLPRGSKVSTAAETSKMMGNTFNFEGMMKGAQFIVREEKDIERIAEELGKYVKMQARKGGVVFGY